eukprot:gene14652-20686_t
MSASAVGETGSPSPRARRLPTKTRSGIITLPPKDSADPGSPTGRVHSPLGRPVLVEPVEPTSLSPSNLNSTTHAKSSPSCNSHPLAQESLESEEESKPCPAPADQPVAPEHKVGGYGGPRTVPKPPPITGPLNASTTPQVQALPVKRRGSYQSLKRHASPNQSNVESEDTPSVMSLLKKSTHWEKFGTILVLFCTKDKESDPDKVLQMLSAEGYDSEVCESQAEALKTFNAREVFPDIVLIDSTHHVYNTMQSKNPTVAIMCLGSPRDSPGSSDVVTVLQGGATDFMHKPLDLDELVARIERHVQRQHGIKLELETALEDAKAVMSQLASAAAIGDMVNCGRQGPESGKAGLNSVAETDFEEQITDLSDENCHLGAKLKEMERQNKMLEVLLSQMNLKIDMNSLGVDGHISTVTEQNLSLQKRIEELERMVQQL